MTQEATNRELEPGRIIADRFRLERLLGKGGMGSVWVAHHLNLNVEVALKFIDASVAQRDDVASRFAQEAQAAAKVKSPHVVNILDYGTDALGRPYIAMELLQGEELAQRLDRWGRLPVPDVCRVVVHACRGLGRAHAAGVVHRDLKPENLFLVDDDEGFVTKVLDFGIAKAHSPIGGSTHHTGTGQILGTPLFMSPEQALGRADIDFRSDLYSLATVAFRCLTGDVPFASEALGEIIVKISTEPVPSARAKRPELPPAVDEWFRRALHKDPAQRFGSAREMSESFLQACDLAMGAYGGSAPPPASLAALRVSRTGEVHVAPGVPRGETLMGATATYSPPLVKRPWVSYLGAGVAGVLAMAAALYMFGSAGPEHRPERERIVPNALSAGTTPPASSNALPAASPPAPSAPVARPSVVPTETPAPPPSALSPPVPPVPPKGAEANRSSEPTADAPARRHVAKPGATPRPAGAKGSSPNSTPPKLGNTDWGID
jgi:serine/threonine-protein kinase